MTSRDSADIKNEGSRARGSKVTGGVGAPSRRYCEPPLPALPTGVETIHRDGSVLFYPVYSWWKEQSATGVRVYSVYWWGKVNFSQ